MLTDKTGALQPEFAAIAPPVKPFSGCVIASVDHESVVRDRTTGKDGLIFTLSTVTCPAEDRCEVEGGYFEAGLSASGNTYYLEKREGKWVVVRDVMHWVA